MKKFGIGLLLSLTVAAVVFSETSVLEEDDGAPTGIVDIAPNPTKYERFSPRTSAEQTAVYIGHLRDFSGVGRGIHEDFSHVALSRWTNMITPSVGISVGHAPPENGGEPAVRLIFYRDHNGVEIEQDTPRVDSRLFIHRPSARKAR